jgi:hypothetical protein
MKPSEWMRAQPAFLGVQGNTILDPDFDIDDGGRMRSRHCRIWLMQCRGSEPFNCMHGGSVSNQGGHHDDLSASSRRRSGIDAGSGRAGPGRAVEKAKGAVDPDCDVGKAARGAATKAVVGVGNRCGVGETTRDTLGIDDREGKKKDDDGALKRVRKD